MRGILPFLVLAVTAPPAAMAQNPAVQSISPDIELGPTVSASSGATGFRVSASSGTVTRISGSGYRISGAAARSLVTLSCGSDPACATESVLVTVGSIGAPTGRIGAPDNFSVQEVTAVIPQAPVGADPITFTMSPIGMNATATFYLGADIPVLGDDSGEPTGAAVSAFEVSASIPLVGSDAATGQATAIVYRPLNVTTISGLMFGAIVRPTTGEGSVAIDADTGQRTVDGAGMYAIGAAPSRAEFEVTGEGGQIFNVSVPEIFEMSGPGDPIVVTLTTDAIGPQSLDGLPGGTGEAQFHVGGAFTLSAATPGGAYDGMFEVMVQYQ